MDFSCPLTASLPDIYGVLIPSLLILWMGWKTCNWKILSAILWITPIGAGWDVADCLKKSLLHAMNIHRHTHNETIPSFPKVRHQGAKSLAFSWSGPRGRRRDNFFSHGTFQMQDLAPMAVDSWASFREPRIILNCTEDWRKTNMIYSHIHYFPSFLSHAKIILASV